MKRISFFLAILCALILSVGLSSVFAQEGIVDIRAVGGLFSKDTVFTGTPIRFVIGVNNDIGLKADIANGWRCFSPDGATPDSVTIDSCGPYSGGLGKLANYFSVAYSFIPDPSINGQDTVGILMAGKGTKPLEQLPAGYNDTVAAVIAWYGVGTKATNDGKHLCIDSSFFQPGGTWLWVDKNLGNHTPTWVNNMPGAPAHTANGFCYLMYNVPNLAPQVKNTGSGCPGGAFVDPTLSGSHCGAFTYNFDACDAEGDPITFHQVSGPGTIDGATGVWSASGLATGSYSVVVNASDPIAGSGPNVTLSLTVTNAAPAIAGACGATITTSTSTLTTANFTSTDADACDPKIWSTDQPALTTTSIAGGVLSFTTTTAGDYTVTVGVSDGIGAPVTCQVTFHVLAGATNAITIQKTHNTLQGGFVADTVWLNRLGNSLGGFDLLIAYDNSALSLQNVTPAGIYDVCKWEYFTYRFGANGNCSGGCPSGLVRVVGLAETNNGANHPICFTPTTPISMFVLNFLVSNNRTFACQYVPVRFFWLDCGDNTLSTVNGDSLIIEKHVYEYYGATSNPPVFVDPNSAIFPGYAGVPIGACTDIGKGIIKADIDFYNGGIDIVCAESIDARGDINLNNVSYEIADAVMFTNYFIKGITAFGTNPTHQQGSIAASDVNADGIALSVADLVYLIRVIVGDAAAYPKTASNAVSTLSTTVSNNDGTLSVSDAMGAAYIVVSGNVIPSLLAKNMDMTYGFDGANTRIVVAPSTDKSRFSSFSGAFINVNGAEVLSIDLATLKGEAVAAKVAPANFSLKQNYPNPFNPTTTISFSLPVASNYTLTVYNVTGQAVAEFNGASQAGEVKIDWNASNNASGVYFYKVSAGSFTATKKMVLLK